MEHFLARGITLPEAYHKALRYLQDEGNVVPVPDYDTTMKEVGMTFYVEKANAEPMISKLFPGGHHELQQYKMEIVDGILDFMTVLGGNYWEYTYHQRFAYQLDFIVEEFKRNPLTRRATINIRDFEVDTSNSHPACLQSISLYQRDGKLDICVTMRSNDAVQATFMNAFGFIMLQQYILDRLNTENGTDWEMGSYTHTSYSFHAYESSFETLEKYAKDYLHKDNNDLAYSYEEFYKELMEEEIPSIMKQVEVLREKHKDELK